jgi:hypothetical protein
LIVKYCAFHIRDGRRFRISINDGFGCGRSSGRRCGFRNR